MDGVKEKFLLLLLTDISDGRKLSDICLHLGKTKQALNYHLKRLRMLKILERVQSYPYSIYKLTSFGERVKRIIGQSEHVRNLWKAHNLITGFQIVSFGKFNFIENESRKLVPMNNWTYARETQGDFVINIQDTGLLKIYCPEEVTDEPDVAFGKMYANSQRIAQEYCDKYDMKLKPMKVIRKGEKSLIGSEKLAKILGRGKFGEHFYVNASDGTEELEERQDSNSIEDLIGVPKRIDQLEDHLVRQTEIMDRFSKQIELHLEVLTKISASIDILNKRLGEKDGRN